MSAVQLHSDTTYPEIALDPTGKGAQFHRTVLCSCPSPPPSSDANHKPSLSPVLLTNGLQIGGSHDPFLGLVKFARAAHRTQRNNLLTRLLVYYTHIQLWNN